MRTLNVRLAAILLGAVVVFGGGIYLLHGFQVKRNSQVFLAAADRALEKAAEAAKAGDLVGQQEATNEAIRCLNSYAQVRPDDFEAIERLALLLAKQAYDGRTVKSRRAFAQAYEMLDGVVRRSPERKAARQEFVKMAMLARQFQDAKEHLEGYLLKESPKDPELLELLGRCQAGLGDFTPAYDSFTKAIEYGPDQLNAFVELANLLRSRLSRPQDADRIMQQLVADNPQSAKAHILRGRYLLDVDAENLLDQATAEAAKAVSLAPDDAEALGFAAACALQTAQQPGISPEKREQACQRARDYIAHGLKLFPASISLHSRLADAEIISNNRPQAIAAIQTGLKATNRHHELLWKLANLQIEAGELQTAGQVVDELREKAAANEIRDFLPDYLAARIEYARGHWRAAREGFEKIRGALVAVQYQNLAKQVDLWISECYAHSGDTDQQLKAIRRALSIDPTWTTALAYESRALLKQGRVEDARRASARMKGKNISLELLRGWINEIGREPPHERNWTPVERLLDSAEKAKPGAPELVQLRALMLALKGQETEAESLLRDACKKDPKQPLLWMSLAMLAQRKGDWEATEKILKESEAALGDGPAQRILTAAYLVRRYGEDARDRLRKLADNTEQFSDGERMRLWTGLVEFSRQIRDLKQTDVLCRRIAEKEPDNAEIRYHQFQLALQAQDQAAMNRMLDEIRQVAGENFYWLWGRALLLDMQSRKQKDPGPALEEAMRFLVKARDMRGDWPPIHVLMGQIHYRQDQPNLAIRDFLEAIDLGYRDPLVIAKTLELLVQTQDYAEADRRIRWLEKQRIPFSPEMLRVAATVALELQDFDRAAALADRVAADESASRRDYLWIGKMFDSLASRAKEAEKNEEAAKALAKAEAALLKAVELDATIAANWIMLVQHYYIADNLEKAKEMIAKAEKSLPADKTFLVVAQCYDVLGLADTAEEYYVKALQIAPDNLNAIRGAADFYVRQNKAAEAEPVLRKIVDGAVKSDEADKVWARRQLAINYAKQPSYQNLKKAQELIELNRKSPAGSVADLQLLASLYAPDPSRTRRGEAIGIFEDLIRRQQATIRDRYLLAQTYLAADEWPKASALLRGLIAEAGIDPSFLVVYIDTLLQHDETSDVLGYLGQLRQLSGNSFDVARLEADLFLATKRPQKALNRLTKFIDQSDALPKKRQERLRLVADKLAGVSRTLAKQDNVEMAKKFAQQAEVFYRMNYEGSKPEDRLRLIVFLAGLGQEKLRESLDLLEKSLDDTTAANFAVVADAIQRNIGTKDKELFDRLRQLVEKAVARHGRSTKLLLVLADSSTRQYRYPEAEAYYREILKENPNDAHAMNNLAIVLAMQGVKLDEALKLVNQALETLGPLAPVLDSRAVVRLATNDLEAALRDINDSLDDKETPLRYFHQAQIFSRLGQEHSARTAVHKAIQMKLTEDMLQPSELPDYEKLKKLLQ